MNELEQIAIGLAIRKLRLDAKKTLKESAERCNNTKNWLVNIESGRRRLSFPDAKTLCEFYNSDVRTLSELTDIFLSNLQGK